MLTELIPATSLRLPVQRRVARPWLQLLNAVLRLAGDGAELLRHTEQPWASVTFTGSRHSVALCFRGTDGVGAAEAFIEALPDHEFAMGSRLVADATIVTVEHVTVPLPQVTVEAEFLLLDAD